MERSSSSRSQRRALVVFTILSIALHLLLVLGFLLPTYIRRAHDARLAAEAREQARHRAEERRDQSARAIEEARHKATTQAAEETKQQVAADLKDEFRAVVGDQLKGEDASQMWSEILAQLTAGLDDYSREVAEGNAPEDDLRKGLTDLQSKMLEELAERLRNRGKKELADAFVAQVRDEVSPKLIEFYRKQLQTKIGNALRDAGAKIVADDAAEIRNRRQAVIAALTDAEREARAAALDLAAAKRRLETAAKAADSLRKNNKSDAADEKEAAAVKYEKTAVEKAGKAIETAAQKLQDAAKQADGLAPEVNRAIHVASGDIDNAVQQAGKANDDVQHGKTPDLIASAGEASVSAHKLADAAHAARAAAYEDHGDVTAEARAALKRARDEDLKDLIEKSFWKKYAERSAPRLGDKLTGVFRQTLEQGGVKDEATVKDVGKRVQAALLDQVRDKIAAGQAGTDPLTKAQRLDDVADGPSATGPANHDGKHDAGHGEPNAVAAGPSTHPAGDRDDKHGHSPRQDAIAERIGKTARDLVRSNIDGAGDDDAGDEVAMAAAGGKKAGGKNGKGNDDDGDGKGLAGLANRVGRLAENVKSGRTDLADAALAPGAGGAGAAGAGAAGGAGLGRPHFDEFGRSHGALLRYHGRYVNEAEYAALTKGIHERDLLAARGQATTRRSAEGEIAAAREMETQPVLQAASVLIPPEPKSDPIGTAGKAEPFKPHFKTIRFAAIPYRSKPITIDGDLSEWKDVPELPMTPAIYGKEIKPELKRFPQAVKVQWDNNGFYLAYDVKDADDKITGANPTNFWEGDGIEFWVDALNTKEKHRTQSAHQFWAWVLPSAKNPSFVGGEAQSWPGRDEYIGLGRDVIKTASKRTEAGWTLEVFFPASRFRMLDLQPGRILGMNFSICTGTELYYYWAGTTEIATARRPDTWGDALLAGSAGRLECIDKLASELKRDETAKALTSLRIGESLRIRVTDPDMNLSDTVRDRVAVTVTTRRGAKQAVILEETGNATGIFEGLLRTTLDTGDAPSTVLPLLDGDSITLTYIDQCRPDGARDVPVKLTLPTAAAITQLPQ